MDARRTNGYISAGWALGISFVIVAAQLYFTSALEERHARLTAPAFASLYMAVFGLSVGILLVNPGLIFRKATRATRIFKWFSLWFAALLVGLGIGQLLYRGGEGISFMLPAIPAGALIAAVWERTRLP